MGGKQFADLSRNVASKQFQIKITKCYKNGPKSLEHSAVDRRLILRCMYLHTYTCTVCTHSRFIRCAKTCIHSNATSTSTSISGLFLEVYSQNDPYSYLFAITVEGGPRK
jgi:hypothetical protein